MLVNLGKHMSGIRAVVGAAQEEANGSQLFGLLCNSKSIFGSFNIKPRLSHLPVVSK